MRHAAFLCRIKAPAVQLSKLYSMVCIVSTFACHSSRPAMPQPQDTKEKVREYMERREAERRQNARSPLHDPEQIRREIGWDMIERRQSDRRRR